MRSAKPMRVRDAPIVGVACGVGMGLLTFARARALYPALVVGIGCGLLIMLRFVQWTRRGSEPGDLAKSVRRLAVHWVVLIVAVVAFSVWSALR